MAFLVCQKGKNMSKCIELPFFSHFSRDLRLFHSLFQENSDRYSWFDFCIPGFQIICGILTFISSHLIPALDKLLLKHTICYLGPLLAKWMIPPNATWLLEDKRFPTSCHSLYHLSLCNRAFCSSVFSMLELVYCQTRNFSQDKFSLIGQSKRFHLSCLIFTNQWQSPSISLVEWKF